MACITYQKADPSSCVHPTLKKSTYLASYESMIHLILDEVAWPKVEIGTVLPPQRRRLPIKSKVYKRIEQDEPRKEKRSVTLKCGVCKSLGHNKRTCLGV